MGVGVGVHRTLSRGGSAGRGIYLSPEKNFYFLEQKFFLRRRAAPPPGKTFSRKDLP